MLGIIGKNGAGKVHFVENPFAGDFSLPQLYPCTGGIASLLEVGTGFHPQNDRTGEYLYEWFHHGDDPRRSYPQVG